MLNTLISARRPRWAALCALLLGGLALNACTAQTPERLVAPIEGYNHTSAAINWFSVNGAGGPNISPNTRHRAVVEVAPYDRVGTVDVHFLPCNQVKVSAVSALPGQPGYPYNYPLNMEEPSQC